MKTARQAKILDIIEKNEVETQEELAIMLKNEGFNVTQATISRDIREMRLTKISTDSGKQKYSVVNNNDAELSERLKRVFREAVIKLDYSQNMIVIKTLNGMGMAVAVAVDNMQTSDILGSIAGDDTVFCVAKTHNQAIDFIQMLNRIIDGEI